MLALPHTTLVVPLQRSASDRCSKHEEGTCKNAATFLDTASPNGRNIAECTGTACPTAGVFGRFGNAVHFDGVDDALQWRAAELLFRRQRVRVQDGRVLSGDADTLDRLNDTGGVGSIGQLLKQAGATLPDVQIKVLGDDNAVDYFHSRARTDHHPFVLDLTHEVQQQLPHGLTLTMTRAQSGLKALARVLERWVAHLQGVAVSIQAESRVTDPAWRWHIGLDVEATALLNDLYNGQTVSEARQQRLISQQFAARLDPADTFIQGFVGIRQAGEVGIAKTQLMQRAAQFGEILDQRMVFNVHAGSPLR